MSSFSAKIKEFADKANNDLLLVMRASTQDVTEEILTPKRDGGNMRIDTGFLRASALATLDGSMPSINPNARPPKDASEGSFASNIGAINAIIAKSELNDIISVGFTASYAGIREHHDGFVKLAAQNWVSIVNKNVAKVK